MDAAILPYMAEVKTEKNLLGWKYLADFQIILKKCSLGNSLSDSTKPCWLVLKYGCQWGGAVSFIFANFKNLLLQNYLADFQIILQKCFFGDTLCDSFKSWWLVKKHGAVWWFNFCLMAAERYWPSWASCC